MLFGILEEIFATRTTAEWDERLTAEGQRHAVVRTHAEVADDPHTWENGYLIEGDDPERGRIRAVGSPSASRHPCHPWPGHPRTGPAHRRGPARSGLLLDEIEALRTAGAC